MPSRKTASLEGKVAVVTGGSRGIGAAIAGRLATLGAKVVITARSKDPLEVTAAAIHSHGGSCEPLACDVTRLDDVEKLAATVERAHGRLDILVNNAGVGGPSGPLHTLPPEQWEAILNTNLRGVFFCLRALVPVMLRHGGHIVNISSIAGKNPLPNAAAYAASKWALNGLSYSVAEELRQHNIRVSVVCPGSVHTDFNPHPGKDPAKMLRAEDVAHVVAMLVTQASQSFASEVVLRPTQKP